jgi:hypothetical protein
VTDFTDITFWGYAALPIVFNYALNLLDHRKARIRDVLVFSLALAFTTEFAPQIVPVIALSFLIFFFTRLITAKGKAKYFVTTLERFAPSIALFAALSFQTLRGIIIFVLGGGGLSYSSGSTTVFYYSSENFVNTFRIIGGDYLSMVYQYPNIIGFVIPILAFASLLLVRKRKPSLNLIALSFLVLSILGLAYSIKENQSWVVWLNEHTPLLKVMIAPQRPLYLVSFAYSCMIGVTAHEVMGRLQAIKLPTWKKFHGSHVIKRDAIIVILVSSLILSVNFLYSPYFDTYIQGSMYYSLPSSYNEIQSWLSSNDPSGNYRVLIVPTFSDFPPSLDQFSEGSLGAGQAVANSYVNFVYDAFVQGETQNIGSLLALASVKYVIVNLEPPDLGHFEDLDTRYSRTGSIRVENGLLIGDASNYVKFLDEQKDLERVATEKNFVVYLNKMVVSSLVAYPNQAFILGSMDALYALTELPNFAANSTLPILGYQNAGEAQELAEASSAIIFSNSSFNELQMLLCVPKYGISLSSSGLQQGWTLVPANSSCFSYGDGYVLIDASRNLTTNFKIDTESTYQLWFRVLFAPSASDLGILIDDQNLTTLKAYAPSNLGFQWVNAGSVDLTPGVHTLKLTSYGFNAVDEAVIIPSPIMQEINVSATNMVKNAQTLFIEDFHASTFNVTTPVGEFWIALKQPTPISVTQTMGLIDFDTTQSFIISREGFKPAHNPPSYDFDNANYYFHTAKSGWVKFSFNGSGLVTIAINTPDMAPGEQKYPQQIPLPMSGVNSVPAIVNNTDVYIDMPAGSTFQPVVYAYNPEMNLNVPDNLTEISVQSYVEAGSPAFAVDSVNITEPAISIANGTWLQYGPMQLTSGEHQIDLYQPSQAQQPTAIYNTANLTDIFNYQDARVSYEVTEESAANYYADVSSNKPVFLALTESYHANWAAYADGQQLTHFVALTYANGFILNETGSNSVGVTIEFKPTYQNLINYFQESMWVVVTLSLICLPIANKIRRKMKRSTEMIHAETQ